MNDLSDYQVTFRRNPLFGIWSWEATTPEGKTLRSPNPLAIGSVAKENAEAEALRTIENHAATERVSGAELVERVGAQLPAT